MGCLQYDLGQVCVVFSVHKPLHHIEHHIEINGSQVTHVYNYDSYIDASFAYSTSGEAVSRIAKSISNYFGSSHY